jgi:amidophosphoribosyltransferase
MRSLPGNVGIGQVRYPTAGSTSEEEAQPFYVNAPFGIVLAHNGNLTNAVELKIELFKNDRRHLNTDSDSEVLLNILAHQIQEVTSGYSLDPEGLFRAVSMLHRRVRGSYAVVAQISGYGLLAFRDPHGIRPLCLGISENAGGTEYMIASESVALEGWALSLCAMSSLAKPCSSTSMASCISSNVQIIPASIHARSNTCIWRVRTPSLTVRRCI